MNGPSWYDAAGYCNWLSEREGLDKRGATSQTRRGSMTRA